MLKNRLIPCIIIKGDLVVQSFFFKRYLPIGNAKTAIEFFVDWDVDTKEHILDIRLKLPLFNDKIEYFDKSNKSLGYKLKDGKKSKTQEHMVLQILVKILLPSHCKVE